MINLSPAAGWIKHYEQLAKLQTLELEEVTIGSYAFTERAGNSGDTYFWTGDSDDVYASSAERDESIFINSMGIPCRSFEWFCEHFKFYVEAAGQSTLRISISPFNQGDLTRMVFQLCRLAREFKADLIIEINLGCPNVWGDGGQKTLASYDLELIRTGLIEAANGRGDSQVRIAVKFSPIFDPAHIRQVVRVCAQFGVYEIVVINTVPNTTLFNTETERTVIYAKPEGSDSLIQLGGQSGLSVLPIAVGNVFMFKQAIIAEDSPIKLKGVGGISCGWSLRQHVLAGADSYAVGSHAIQYGGNVFSEILDEYLTHFG